jgi:tetratricopeptide (TPR) repeat protein
MSTAPYDPAAWQRLAPYLDRALDLDPGERERWLADIAATEPQVATEVRRFLQEHVELDAKGFLEHSPIVPPAWPAARSDFTGRQIGAYQVERLIGRGGMSAVWLASRADGRFEGHCAIKFLNRSISHPGVAERFRREGQALARLTHPHVARLLDAGTLDEGQPYLVLEYVPGSHIDRYCADKSLDVKARVRLFVNVVAAVADAHANLIVHRDLKPSNVLVTGEGVVKLLDFGIAKLLDPESGAGETAPTRWEDAALTPEYSAPEQLLGEPVSTATDVYQLGMLLYVLLVGRHPLQVSGTRTEKIRAALDGRLPLASSFTDGPFRKELRGDLDAILSMALRRDPQERYVTAAALGEDLLRYLNGEPVKARRGATIYVVRKFVARNAVVVALAGIATLMLCIALAFAVNQSRLARQEARRTQDINTFLLSLFKGTAPEESGSSSLTAIELLRHSAERIDEQFAGQPARQIELHATVGQALYDLAAHQESLKAFGKASEIAEHAKLTDLDAAINAKLGAASAWIGLGETAPARKLVDEVARQLPAGRPSLLAARLALERAFVQIYEDDPEAAVASAQSGADLLAKLVGKDHPEYFEAVLLLTQARTHADQCAEAMRDIDDVLQRLARPSSMQKPMAAVFRGLRSRCLRSLDRLDEAAAEFKTNEASIIQLFGANSQDYAVELGDYAMTQLWRGESASALQSARRTVAILEANGIHGHNLLANKRQIMQALLQARDTAAFETAAIEFAALTEPLPRDSLFGGWGQLNLALAQGLNGKTAAAIAALEALERRGQEQDRLAYPELIRSAIGWLHLLDGDYERAVIALETSIPSLRTSTKLASAWVASAQGMAGIAHLELGNTARARQLLEQAERDHARLIPAVTPDRVDLWIGLTRLYLRLGELGEARRYAQMADEFWRHHDPESRWAGEAAYWFAQSLAASGSTQASIEPLRRAERILSSSPFPVDQRRIKARSR